MWFQRTSAVDLGLLEVCGTDAELTDTAARIRAALQLSEIDSEFSRGLRANLLQAGAELPADG